MPTAGLKHHCRTVQSQRRERMHRERLRRVLPLFIVPLLAGALLGACASAPLRTPETVTFAPELGLHLESMERRPSGLYLRDMRVGEGEPVSAPQRVAVYYVGWLPDGTQFDAVAPPAEPYVFRLGGDDVILGWAEGVTGMRPGGQRLLVVPARLAYRRERIANVPPNSVLVFLIELARVD